MSTREEVAAVVATVSAAFPWAQMTTATVNVWYDILEDVDGALIVAATKTLLGEASQYPPSAGMIRQKAFDLASGGEDGWESGWLAWKRHLSECRAPEYLCRHDPDEVFDPVTAHTVRAIGWQTLCRMESSQEATIRAQFRDIWKAEAARQAERDRRHPAVQRVMDAYRQQLEAQDAPRIAAPTTSTPPRQYTVTGVVGDIDAALKRDGRPRHAEFEETVRRIAAQRRGGVL